MLKRPFSACPLCDAALDGCTLHKVADISKHPLYSADLPAQLTWLRCGTCAHVFTQDYWTPAGEAILFAKTLPHQTPGSQPCEPLRGTWAPTVTRVAGILCATRPRAAVFGAAGDARPRWIDVGFGNGALVTTADEFGFDALGIDVRPTAVERLAAAGYAAVCSDFNDFDAETPVAVLSFCDALEHMHDPRQTLHKAHKLLAADGLLYISLPNSETATWRQWEAAGTNPYWAELEHYHNFSRTRLIRLLAQHGFEVVDYSVSSRYYSCLEICARKSGFA